MEGRDPRPQEGSRADLFRGRPLPDLSHIWPELRRVVAMHGARSAFHLGLRRLYLAVLLGGRRRLESLRYRSELEFDRRRGTDTAGISASSASVYVATTPRDFTKLMQDIDVDAPRFTFIDLGCGKGKALILASAYGFGRLLGVEIDADHARTAETNLRQLSIRGIVECGDAAAFQFPQEPSVVFLANPFDADTLRRVLENLRTSLREAPRVVWLVYHYPEHAEWIDRETLFSPVQRVRHAAVYRSVT